MDWVLPTVRRAADFNVYWGVGGLVDSVIDITHNVPVPFQPYMGGGFGILNTAARCRQRAGRAADGPDGDRHGMRRAVGESAASPSQPFASRAPAAPVALSNTAQLGQVAFFKTSLAEAATIAPAADGPGFIFYLAGRLSS